ncbi:MAG TPA: periplasmic heavy metal sensor [Pyrinomonadaceae bacterium]|nr:periplasmic heavy metal sensor [Pyrinomonadaceae bacterium]
MKIVTALLILLTAVTITFAQQDPTIDPGQPDPIEQLHLTPDQRQAIRRIVAENRDERQTTNQRVREANIALDQALDADPPDENLIEQRINDLTAAQAAQLRMRIHTEIKIRRILRPEQIATLRRLRLQVRDVMNPQRRNRLPSNQTFRPRP